MTQTKATYGFEYWLSELVDLGRSVTPDKYTDDYIAIMRREWQRAPLTMLHMKVLKRKRELSQPPGNTKKQSI